MMSMGMLFVPVVVSKLVLGRAAALLVGKRADLVVASQFHFSVLKVGT